MSIFKENNNTQAYFKAGLMGFAGSGKSTTASNIAIGLINLMRDRNIEIGNRPAFFLDTESGSDWLKPTFNKNNIQLLTSKTRAFKDLVPAIKETESNGSVLIIDSITHFWTDLTSSYMNKKNRTKLTFGDWGILKDQWRSFTDAYVNSNAHIILCGRAGFEYDHFEDEDGKKQIEKTGIKMKAEGETGYEASLLILMQRHQELTSDGKIARQWRTASILKDRSTYIDGKSFDNPTFVNFLPHIEFLNLGGTHIGVDVSRNSEELFNNDGKPRWQWEKEQKDIALEEIKDLLMKHYPGQSADEKKHKADIIEKYFNTRTWSRIETINFHSIIEGRNKIWKQLEGNDYNFNMTNNNYDMKKDEKQKPTDDNLSQTEQAKEELLFPGDL